MKILLTGGTGFVGRNLLLAAMEDPGVEKIGVCVRHASKLLGQLALDGIRGVPEKVQILEGSSRNWHLERLEFEPEVCVHLAGVLFARTRQEYFSGNVDGARNLLRALPKGCRMLALSSQSAVGPSGAGGKALMETCDPNPLSFYGESKLEMEKVLLEEGRGRRCVILRPPVVLGPRDAATVPLFQMVQGPLRFKPCIQEKRLSWIAVEDLVEAIFTALRCEELEGTYFVSATEAITDRELIETAAAVCGKSGGVLLPLPKPVLRLVSKVSGWVPAIGAAAPSLMPDRSRELMEDVWLVESDKFRSATGWSSKRKLHPTLLETWKFLQRK